MLTAWADKDTQLWQLHLALSPDVENSWLFLHSTTPAYSPHQTLHISFICVMLAYKAQYEGRASQQAMELIAIQPSIVIEARLWLWLGLCQLCAIPGCDQVTASPSLY